MLGQQSINVDAAHGGPGLEAFQDDRLLLAATYWGLIRGDKDAPVRADLDPGAMPPDILPWIVLFMAEGDRIRVRLAGTGLRDFIGRDATGSYVDELTTNEAYNAFVTERLNRVRQTGRCLYCEVETALNGETKRSQRFIAPMSKTGHDIDMMFMCLSYENEDGPPTGGAGPLGIKPHTFRTRQAGLFTFEPVTEFFLNI